MCALAALNHVFLDRWWQGLLSVAITERDDVYSLGESLHQTLCYCLVPYRNREVMCGDSALWEREPKQLPLANPKRISSGYADLFTWQPRMILLDEMPSGGVCAMRFVAGEGFENPSQDSDPMQPYNTTSPRERCLFSSGKIVGLGETSLP